MRTSHARPYACYLATLAAHVVVPLLFKSQDCRSRALEQVWKLELSIMHGGLDIGSALLGSVTLTVVHAQSVSGQIDKSSASSQSILRIVPIHILS